MSKLKLIGITAAITAAIALPIGAYADVMLRGHPNLQRAHHALHEAKEAISASQKANEKVWGDEGGHGKEAKQAIDAACREIDLAAEWVNSHGK
jgi:hypothetical protein